MNEPCFETLQVKLKYGTILQFSVGRNREDNMFKGLVYCGQLFAGSDLGQRAKDVFTVLEPLWKPWNPPVLPVHFPWDLTFALFFP